MEERTNNFVDLEALSYYNQLNNRLNKDGENFNYVIDHMPPAYANTDAYIKNYVKDLTPDELKARADGLIKAQNLDQNHELIDYMSSKNRGNFSHFRSQWSPIMWQAHEKENAPKIKIGEKVVNAHDLDYSIAESLEVQDASRDPVTEYHDWIQIQAAIENNINSSGTTLTEIQQRDFFIGFMDMRETEIKRIATLYSAAALNPNSPMQAIAQEKLKFTLFKLSELRRLRDRMKSTKSRPDNFNSLPAHVQAAERVRHKMANRPTPEERKDMFDMAAQLDDEEKSLDDSFIDSLGEQRLNNLFMAHAITHGVSDAIIQSRPVTNTVEEATNKINVLSDPERPSISEIIYAYRNGRSKEDIMADEQLRTNIAQHIKRHMVRGHRGFDIKAYHDALRELNK